MASKKFYITTPIYYVNDVPHIGHAYTTIAADILARWHRSIGNTVFFLTGTDEHGLKIQRAAQAANKEPQDFVDDLAQKFKYAWQKLNINFDVFWRTTDPEHEKRVQKFIKLVAKRGDIYKGAYEGLYCVSCEAYYSEKDLIGSKTCPIHKKEAELIKEESYFFKLSKYQDELLKLYQKNPALIGPTGKRSEVISRIKEGLKDLSISRTSFTWGVPFPLDKKHITYVWFDALTNYITALGWPSNKKFKQFWPADVHLVGKDILWFHTAIWHAMLLSAGLELPKIFAHGWWTVDGQKMSKTAGNVVDPVKISERYGVDAFRYFLFRTVPFGEDGDFSEKIMVERLNSDLADNLGNLLSRGLTLIEKFSDGEVPKGRPDINLKKEFEKVLKDASKYAEQIEVHHALEKIFSFVSLANKYVNDSKPWELAKNKKVGELNDVLYNIAECLRVISAFTWPFIPESAEKIAKQLGIETPRLDKIKFGQLKAGTKINKGEILFKKIDKFNAERSPADFASQSKPVKLGPTQTTVRPYSSQVDLRVAEIKEAEAIPDSDKLIRLQIDVGELGGRQIVAGIRKFYQPAELVGRKIIVVANLKPVKLRGVDSNGMLLAAEDGKQLEVISPQGENGERILSDGIKFNAERSPADPSERSSLVQKIGSTNFLGFASQSEPTKEIEIKELEKLGLKVENNKLSANGNVLKTQKGEVKTKFVVAGSVR